MTHISLAINAMISAWRWSFVQHCTDLSLELNTQEEDQRSNQPQCELWSLLIVGKPKKDKVGSQSKKTNLDSYLKLPWQSCIHSSTCCLWPRLSIYFVRSLANKNVGRNPEPLPHVSFSTVGLRGHPGQLEFGLSVECFDDGDTHLRIYFGLGTIGRRTLTGHLGWGITGPWVEALMLQGRQCSTVALGHRMLVTG